MASASFAHSLFVSPVLPATPTMCKSPKFLTSGISLHHGEIRNSLFVFASLRSPRHPRKSLSAECVSDTKPKGINEIEMENKFKCLEEQKYDMSTLCLAYKEAYLTGDENNVSEIESSICLVEKETNELSSKSACLVSEIASAKDNLLRLNADFENFRKRSEKDHRTFTMDNRAEVIERFLAIVDNFETVKQQLKPETEKEKKIDTSYQGIYKQLVEIMRSMHVSVLETVGRSFDPTIHVAIAREESQQFKIGIVTQELRRGFFIGDRVLRKAFVKVSTGPGLEKAFSSATKFMEQPHADV